MFLLSDRGKYQARKLFTLRYLLLLFALFFFFAGSYSIFSVSSSSQKETIAQKFAEDAENSTNKSIELFGTSDVVKTRSEYGNFFNVCRQLYSYNRYREYFDSYCCFVSSGTEFSDHYAYYCKDIFNDFNDPISLFASPLNTIRKSQGKYFHEIWRVNFMFPDNVIASTDGGKSSNFAYIPLSAANNMLSKEGVSHPVLDDYKSLIGKTVSLDFYDYDTLSHQTLNWCISNIVYEDETSNYFYSRLGNVLFTYTSLPVFEYPSLFISFGHSRFACKDYLNLLTSNREFKELTFTIKEQKSESWKPNITNQNINSILSSYQLEGVPIYICLIFYIFVAILFSIIFILLFYRLYYKICLMANFVIFSIIIFYFLLDLYCLISGSFVMTIASLSVVVSCVFSLSVFSVFKLCRNKLFQSSSRMGVDVFKI